MRLHRRLSLVLVLVLAVAGAARLAPQTLLLRVVDETSRRPLPNAEVTTGGMRRLTDGRGEVRFTWPPDGSIAVRIRQLGFRYVDRTFRRSASATATEDTVVVGLSRMAFALPQVVTKADTRCPIVSDPQAVALSASTLELLRLGAQQYDNFRFTYPFAVVLGRRTVRAEARKPDERIVEREEQSNSDGYGDAYKPGKVLQRTKDGGFFVPVLFVSTLADSTFWSRHCFAARGVESLDGRRVIRLDFSAARGIRDVEWEGSALLDSALNVLTRVDFRLANLRGDGPRRFEGYTVFSFPSPYIAVPDSTVAWWWSTMDPPRNGDPRTAEVRQTLAIRELAYTREMPPSAVEDSVTAK